MSFRSNKAQGFSLLEVLISMLILSVGLLGLMSLQLMSLQTNNNSSTRSLATISAYDMSERIRANINALDSYTSGSGNAMATADMQEWRTELAKLPDGTGTITQSSGDPNSVDITVFWTENNPGGSNSTESFILRARFQ